MVNTHPSNSQNPHKHEIPKFDGKSPFAHSQTLETFPDTYILSDEKLYRRVISSHSHGCPIHDFGADPNQNHCNCVYEEVK